MRTESPHRQGPAARSTFIESLRRECLVADAVGRPLSVAVLQLDQFALVHDTHGREAAGLLLDRFVRAVAGALRGGERAYRYAGATVSCLMPAALDEALLRLEEVRRTARVPEQTLSAGVSQWDRRSDPEAALATAHAALCLAMMTTGSQTVVAEARASLMPGPFRDIQTFFQPILAMADGAVAGYESLSRFPQSSAVERVFADAYADGYGDLLEARAIDRAVSESGTAGRRCRVFVNVSERALRSPRFWETLPASLEDVVVELAKGPDLGSLDELGRIIDRLRMRGAEIALDAVTRTTNDLARLDRLHPDVIKVGLSLVSGCDRDRERWHRVETLSERARRRNVDVVAAGVETPGELRAVAAAGVTHAQGFYLGRPEPARSSAPMIVAG